MAENNIQVVIPKQESVDAMVSALTNVFAEASGMTADENGIFWIEENSLGLRVKAYSNNVYIYAVEYNGTETAITYYSGYNNDTVFMYNKSVGGGVFAFEVTSTSAATKHLRAAIATDASGITRLVVPGSSDWMLYSPGVAKVSISASTNKIADFVTLIKLPAIHSRSTFSELYQIYAMPNASFGTDSSLYIGGGLYKIVTTGGFGLAFRVA